jgi:hypothetical protein
MTTTDEEYATTGLGENSTTEHLDSLLANRRRRYLLYCLSFYANPMRLSDVADQVVVWECGDVPATNEGRRHRVYESLCNDHIPVLQDRNIVEYDQSDDMVELGAAATRVESALNAYVESEIDDLLAAEGRTIAHD